MPRTYCFWSVSAVVLMYLSSIQRVSCCVRVICPYQVDFATLPPSHAVCETWCDILLKENWEKLYNNDRTYKTWSGKEAIKPKWKLDELERESGVCLNSGYQINPQDMHCSCVGTITFMRLDNGDDQKSKDLVDRLASMFVQARDDGRLSSQLDSTFANPFSRTGIEPWWEKEVDCHWHKHNCWCDGNGQSQGKSCKRVSFETAKNKGP